MVTFICGICGESLKKAQVNKHCETKCRNAWSFTCMDCNKVFEGFEFEKHISCMTETERYQGKYLAKKNQKNGLTRTPSKDTKLEESKEANKESQEIGKLTGKRKRNGEIKKVKEGKKEERALKWEGLSKRMEIILEKREGNKMKKKELFKKCLSEYVQTHTETSEAQIKNKLKKEFKHTLSNNKSIFSILPK